MFLAVSYSGFIEAHTLWRSICSSYAHFFPTNVRPSLEYFSIQIGVKLFEVKASSETVHSPRQTSDWTTSEGRSSCCLPLFTLSDTLIRISFISSHPPMTSTSTVGPCCSNKWTTLTAKWLTLQCQQRGASLLCNPNPAVAQNWINELAFCLMEHTTFSRKGSSLARLIIVAFGLQSVYIYPT